MLALMTSAAARRNGAAMRGLRAILLRNRTLAMALVALALAMRALIPAGFMPGKTATSSFTVLVCADATGLHSPMTITVAKHGAPAQAPEQAKANEHCAFAGLGMAALSGADPALLAAAIAFLVALGFGPVALPALRRAPRILPPPCGPPALS
ncbi:hypothetical protein HHL27_05175 [Novosphingobium sp. TW-4]|uniref:DUF2946 domain-containing protein n=2 Tax=Novosphingobium olei TaxID=2728851 RepID=A0A7Y0BMS8_9SPHN|nr:hypothetical protein [Novosphingobium olei]